MPFFMTEILSEEKPAPNVRRNMQPLITGRPGIPQDPGWQHNWLLTVLVSFIGTFGLMQIYMPYGVSKVYFLFFGLGGVGILSMLGMFYPKKRTVVKERKTSGSEKLKIKTVTVSDKWERNLPSVDDPSDPDSCGTIYVLCILQ